MGLGVGPKGRLLAVLNVQAQDAVERPPDYDLELDPGPMLSTFDARLELIDPASGRIVATAHHPESIDGFASRSLLWSLASTPIGVFVVDIWRVHYPQ